VNEQPRVADLTPEEIAVHTVLASVPPQSLPLGFRDAVMRRVAPQRRVGWEWLVAALLALPSLAFLARQLIVSGQDFVAAIANVIIAATTDTSDAVFFVDGLTVLAVALIGISSVFAAHAFVATMPGRSRPRPIR